MSLEGKVALVTGAGQGIGAAIAVELARKGACLAVNDIDPSGAEQTCARIRDKGGVARAFPADVSDETDVEGMVQNILTTMHSLDILVNNAGILNLAATEDLAVEQWEQCLSVNLKGAFLCCKAALPHMKAKSYGKIINISSLAGESGGIMVGPDYAASKAGLLALTKKVALETAPWGINANAIAPGTTQTVMIDNMQEEQRETLRRKIPLGRFGRPEDIAHAVCFLASEDASFITGATLDVNGGLLMR